MILISKWTIDSIGVVRNAFFWVGGRVDVEGGRYNRQVNGSGKLHVRFYVRMFPVWKLNEAQYSPAEM